MAVWNRDLIVQKIDKVLGDTKQILTALSGGTGAVKSVQRGRCSFHGAPRNDEGIYYREVNISPVNPQKSIVLIDGVLGSTYTREVFLFDLTSNTLSLGVTGTVSGSSNEIKNISWQLIEYY